MVVGRYERERRANGSPGYGSNTYTPPSGGSVVSRIPSSGYVAPRISSSVPSQVSTISTTAEDDSTAHVAVKPKTKVSFWEVVVRTTAAVGAIAILYDAAKHRDKR